MKVTGKIAVSISQKPSGEVVWDKTVNYNGGTRKVVGPVLARGHDYVALARFFRPTRPSRGAVPARRSPDKMADALAAVPL